MTFGVYLRDALIAGDKMRKTLLFIFAVTWTILFSYSMSHAAITCTEGTTVHEIGGHLNVVVNVQFDTSPGTATCTLDSSIMSEMIGQVLYSLTIVNGATGASAATDLQIKDSRGQYLVDPASRGANIGGDNVVNQILPEIYPSDAPFFQKMYTAYPLTITFTSNAVNNSSLDLHFDLWSQR